MSKRDYYQILEISKTSTETEIKKAYRKLAHQYHPDKNPDNVEAETKFKEASEAYEILSNPQKRQLYDQYGHQGLEGFGGSGFSNAEDIFGSFSDIFEDFFGFGGGGQRRSRPQKGADLRYDLEIDFLEACFGCEKEIEIEKRDPCQDCQGVGGETVTCPECQGAGQIRHSQGFFTISSACSACQGRGQALSKLCDNCRGDGVIKKQKKITVTVPEGIDNDMKLLLHGEGEAGLKGGPHGNLYVFIQVKNHSEFKREGADIYLSVPISMTQASLGDEIEIPTIRGVKNISIKEGTQPNDHIVLKNEGVKHVRSKKIGNQIIEFKVEIPKKLSKEQKELLEKFQNSMGEVKNKPNSKKKKKKGFLGDILG